MDIRGKDGNRCPTIVNEQGRVVGYWDAKQGASRAYTVNMPMAHPGQFGWAATVSKRRDGGYILRWRLRFVSGDPWGYNKYVEPGDGYKEWWPLVKPDGDELVAIAEAAIIYRPKQDDYIQPNYRLDDIAVKEIEWQKGYRIGHNAGWELCERTQKSKQRRRAHERAGIFKTGKGYKTFCGKTGTNPGDCDCLDFEVVWL